MAINRTIAIDARPLAGNVTNGYAIYLRSLLPAVLAGGAEVTLVSDQALDSTDPLVKQCRVVILPPRRKVVWEQLSVRGYLKAHDFDIYFVGSNTGLPLLYHGRTRLYLGLLDVIPLRLPSQYLWGRPRQGLKYLLEQPAAVIRANKILTISHASAYDIEHFFPFKLVIPIFIDLGYFPVPVTVKTVKPQFAYVGGVDPRKKIDQLLRAFAEFGREHGDYRLVLIGKGYEIFNPLLDELGITERVTFTGFISEKEKARVMSESLAIVYPSLYEGYGLAIAEGLLAGRPVIAGRGGSQMEVGGEAVLYVDPKSPQEIAAAMETIIQPDVQARLVARRGEQIARLTAHEIDQDIRAAFDLEEPTQTTRTRVLHVRPSFGGIADYGKVIEGLYQQEGFEIDALVADQGVRVRQVVREVKQRQPDVVHFEIGVGQPNLFWASLRLTLSSRIKQIATIHDPGIVVKVVIAQLEYSPSTPRAIRLVVRVIRKGANLTINRLLIVLWVRSRRVFKLYLRPDLGQRPGSRYLPQPTYHSKLPVSSQLPDDPKAKLRVGFAGYWGREKGLETLITARKLLGPQPHLQFVLGGGGAASQDAYVIKMKEQAQVVDQAVELPGVVDDDQLDDFIAGLNAMALPYWRELPSGTSAMAMRAAELGVPIIASDTPALRGQLGNLAIYAEPKDAASLSAAIERFLAHPDQAYENARELRNQIYTEHSWAAVGRQLRDIIEQTEVKS